MAVNSNFNAQSSASPVSGAYAQPAAGIAETVVTAADPAGNAYATSLAAAGVANLQTASFRDSVTSVQAGSKASAPSAGGTVVAVTPGTAGLWEVSGLLGMTGTTAVATDTNNMALNVGTVPAISNITYAVTGTAGASTSVIPPVILNLGSTSVVNVTAVANSTASSVYSATLVARRVG